MSQLEMPYVYQDLDDEPQNTIRLLEVHPEKSNLIRCSLKFAVIDDSLSFSALSYKWGDEEADEVIMINGLQFQVRRNLWALLKRLQRLSNSTVIWIDAICVNQKTYRNATSRFAS
jgi:hypothetical protein